MKEKTYIQRIDYIITQMVHRKDVRTIINKRKSKQNYKNIV